MYRNGLDVPEDYKLAVEWYRKSAEQGIKHARDAVSRLQVKVLEQ
jgi:TPR repeat protein